MVSAENIKPGQLLISAKHRLYCIIEIKLDQENPDNSIITGIDEKNWKYEGTPDKWFYLWDSSIDLSTINCNTCK